jgi:hypothetical protein
MYILPDARASYVHWWKRQLDTYELWYAYRHLNIPALDYIPRRPRKWPKYGRRWIRPWDVSTSGESSFRQNGYDKKEKDQIREDWRERKQFKRDKAKRYQRRSCPKWLKRQCNKDYRAWQKKLLAHDRDEEICWRKDFYDPWMWS